MNRRFLTIGLIIVGILILGAIIYGLVILSSNKGTITVWTMQGTEPEIKKIADVYHQKHKSVGINIVPVPEQVFEYKSLFGLASRKGPDVWIIPNDWMAQHRNKLVAAPEKTLDHAISGYRRLRQKNETVPTFPPKGRTNVQVVEQDYAPIIKNDLVTDTNVWGVPLNLDTLALFYDKTQINPPPKTWKDVVNATRQFTLKNGSTVTRSTIALGDVDSVAHPYDILTTLMLQNGTQMVDEKDQIATFNISKTGAEPPGTNAIDFYTSFTRTDKDVYTWNKSFGTSIQALKDGKTLMALGYLADLSQVGPIGNTRIAVAPLPQVDSNNPKTYGHYLVATVTKQSAKPQQAWDFASFFANPDISEQYANDLRLVSPRIDVASRLTLGPQYKAFQEQTAYATNWQKKEVNVADGAIREAVRLILQDHVKPQTALDTEGKSYTEFLQTPTGIETDPQVLSFWQLENDPIDYKDQIGNFVTETKTLKRIAVSKHTSDRYEWEVLNAEAAHQGPDILLVPNDQVNHFSTTLRDFIPHYFNPSNNRVSDIVALQRTFAPAVVTDVVVNNKIYAIPGAFQTLELAYNVKLFQDLAQENNDSIRSDYNKNQSLFTEGPILWDDIKLMTKIATKRNGAQLTRPFIALGTGSNVAHSQDIFAALEKQYGGEMTDPDRLVSGIHLPKAGRIPGQDALDLIKSFGQSQNDNYSWNISEPNSIDAFAHEQVMTAFVYPQDIKKIKAINPKISVGTFVFPQVAITGTAVDYASYYAMAIPLFAKRPNDGIRFIHNVVFNNFEQYIAPLLVENQSPSIKDRIDVGNPQTIQINTAQSYYKGLFPQDTDQAIIDLLDNKINLEQAANRMNQSLKRTIL